MLDTLDVHVDIRAEPFGVPMTTPFAADHEHASYDTDAVARFLRVLQWSADVLEEFAGWYCGKASPVHVFWHGFDLAISRFSGKRAPAHPASTPVTAEAYSHEVISFGFWAGDKPSAFPAYYSYTAPEPAGLTKQALRPGSAEWVARGNGSLAILRYDDVRALGRPQGHAPRVPPERLRSGCVARRLGPRRHRDAMVPGPVEPAPPDVAAEDARQTPRVNDPTAGAGCVPNVHPRRSRA